ncbi:unnamed protein product [Moneuplotes crassus]|uniref:Palmitoyltransferase n=1 Tax=Euplotes crassus TaxID=5936 RepID=A0AAD1XN64_EUPCR|nr:unnamed protein product [Moneuplotes crassus]
MRKTEKGQGGNPWVKKIVKKITSPSSYAGRSLGHRAPKGMTKVSTFDDEENIFPKTFEVTVKRKGEKKIGKYPGYICCGIYEYGNCYAMCFDKHGSPWITIGPDFCFTICLFIFLSLIYSVFLYFSTHLKSYYPILVFLGVVLVLVNLFSTLFTVFINPGHPSKRLSVPPHREWCRMCNSPCLPEYETFHCDDCNKCVEYYDHHCPWFGKCIGKNNIITFYIFIASFMILIFATFFSVAMYMEQHKKKDS